MNSYKFDIGEKVVIDGVDGTIVSMVNCGGENTYGISSKDYNFGYYVESYISSFVSIRDLKFKKLLDE